MGCLNLKNEWTDRAVTKITKYLQEDNIDEMLTIDNAILFSRFFGKKEIGTFY